MPTSLPSLLAAIALLLPSAPAVVPDGGALAGEPWDAAAMPDLPSMMLGADEDEGSVFRSLAQSWQPDSAGQVRIEQHIIIRIAPRAPEMMFDAPAAPSFYERKTSRCLAVQGISGVQALDSRLMLVMRDRRLIGATLDRSCRARDFYSGFYVEHTADGMLCAGRDDIHSRAGATCAVTALHELIPND